MREVDLTSRCQGETLDLTSRCQGETLDLTSRCQGETLEKQILHQVVREKRERSRSYIKVSGRNVREVDLTSRCQGETLEK